MILVAWRISGSPCCHPISYTFGGLVMLVKEFKLRQGARHTQDGQAVQVGDTVQLTKAQATAFRDKFEAVDDSDFEEVENVEPYKPQAGEEDGETKGATEEAPQG